MVVAEIVSTRTLLNESPYDTSWLKYSSIQSETLDPL
jgi:hypothetical protein